MNHHQNPRWFAVLALTLLIGCDEKKTDALTGSGNVDFGYVTVGETTSGFFATLGNEGEDAINITALDVVGPFEVNSPTRFSIAPGGWGAVSIRFTGEVPAIVTGRLTVQSDGGDESFHLSAQVVPDVRGDVEDYASVSLEPGPLTRVGEATVLSGFVEVATGGAVPLEHRDATLSLALDGIPAAASLDFDPPTLSFGPPRRIPFSLTSVSPLGNFEIAASARLMQGTSLLYTYGATTPIFWQAPPPPALCNCPAGTPAPTLNALPAGTFTGYFPNSPIAPGDAPGATRFKVAKVTGEVSGPALGQCCQSNAKFRTRVTISSAFPLPGGGNVNNQYTGIQLANACQGLNGMSITASTNNTAHTVSSSAASTVQCPANPPAVPAGPGAVGKVELETTYDVPITCATAPNCPCQPAQTSFWSDVSYDGAGGMGGAVAGAGVALVRVYWQLSVGAHANDCVMGAIGANAVRMLFDRAGDVYDPANHNWGWLPAGGDADGDGLNNVTEMHRGRNPTRPGP